MALRVTRQYVQVLGPMARTVDAIDALVLTDLTDAVLTVGGVTVYNQSVVQDLSLGDEVLVVSVYGVHCISLLAVSDAATVVSTKFVQHTLLLTQSVIWDLIRSCTDVLTPTDAAIEVATYARIISDTLPAGVEASRLAEFVRSSVDTLVLGQNVISDHCRTVITTIGLSDGVSVDLVRPVQDDLELTDLTESNWIFIRRRTDGLTLTHAAVKATEYPRSSLSSLTSTQLATVVASKSVVDVLTVTQIASADNVRLASDTLILTHTVLVVNIRTSAEDDLLSLTHVASVGFVKQVTAASTLRLTHRAGSGFKVGVVVSVLQESYYTVDLDTGAVISTYVGLQDAVVVAVVRNTPYAVSHIISFAEHAIGIVVHADAVAVDATDALSLTHAAYVNKAPTALHTVVVTDTAVVTASKTIDDTLVLTVTATVNVFRAALAVVDTLALGQSVAVIGGLTSTILHQYHPFVGEGATGNPTPPSAVLSGPMLGIEAPFQLVYPAEGTVTDSVTLRAPELGNKDRLSFNRVIRETRGGTLIVFADPMWPKIQTLALNFVGLRRSEAQDLLDFFDAYLGLEIGMIDWEQRYWVGIIMTPDEPIIEDSYNSYSVGFEFEGELDPTWMPQVIPYIPGTPLQRVQRDRFRAGLENPEQPAPAGIPEDSYYALADEEMFAGQVLYIKANEHAALARANAAATMGAVGLVFASVGVGETVCYITEGHITLADWTAVAGVAVLTPGSNYFLSTSSAGKIAAAPTVAGNYVVQIGRAVSETTLDIEISPPIRL